MGILYCDLILMRHGRTRWNQEKRYLGHTDVSLSSEGRRELLPLSEHLVSLKITRVYCSDLIRCRESLMEVSPELAAKAIYDHRLREMDFGDWEGCTYDELQHVQHYRDWLDTPEDIAPPNGEEWAGFTSRIAEFMQSVTEWIELQSILDQERRGSQKILVVTHGGVIRQLAAMTIPGSSFWDVNVEPGSTISLRITRTSEGWEAATYKG